MEEIFQLPPRTFQNPLSAGSEKHEHYFPQNTYEAGPYPDHSFLIHSGHQLYVEIPVRKVLHFQKLFSYLFCQMFLHNLPLSVLS